MDNTSNKNRVPEMFGSMVFNDRVMKERLPKETYKALLRTIEEGRKLDPAVASVVANAMKDWATEKGANHFTHWFQLAAAALTAIRVVTSAYLRLLT